MKAAVAASIAFVRRFLREASSDDLSGAAAELSYRLFLALFPFFIFVAALGSFVARLTHVANPTENILKVLGDSLPPEAETLLREQLDDVIRSQDAGLVSIGIIGAIWAASGAMGTLIKTLNRVHEVSESRPLWKRYAVAVSLTFLAGGSLIAAFILFVLGQLYGIEIARSIGLGGAWPYVLVYGRLPLLIAFLLLATAFLYWAAPNARLPFRLVSPGSLLFVAGWSVVTFGFGVYVSNFGSYNTTYGTLGGVAVILIWFYLSSLVLLAGAELDSVLRQLDRERRRLAATGDGEPSRSSPRKRTRLKAPAVAPVLLGAVLGLGSMLAKRSKKPARTPRSQAP